VPEPIIETRGLTVFYGRHRGIIDVDLAIRECSSGNRRKLGLVIAVMHRPELLTLDGPARGLDPLVN
jgi:ABC-2 type transport system ATP-binding protein